MIHILLFFTILIFPFNSWSSENKDIEFSKGGLHIYRELVDQYWNDWIAYPLIERARLPHDGQVLITLTGEGKTIEFIGNLSINCTNKEYFWLSASEGYRIIGSADKVEQFVPSFVTSKLINHICKIGK